MTRETVVVVGSGLVGKSWAMLFASGGHEVRLFDAIPEVLSGAPKFIYDKLHALEAKGQLKDHLLNAEEQCKLITAVPTLSDAVKGDTYIQECTPENIEMKTKIFEQLDKALSEVGNTKACIGSSTSTIMPSKFMAAFGIKDRMLVAHPINPPYFVKLVELIPSTWTKAEVTSHVKELLAGLGMKPIVMNKEVPGFALNRIQYAILNETWRLVMDGILSAEDADIVMKEGLAPRYVFMGPLETAQLNAEGFIDYCKRYGQGIHDVSVTMQEIPKMTEESSVEIDRQLQSLTPNANLGERRNWRDENLAELATFKKRLGL